MQHLSVTFFLVLLLQRNFFSLRLRHQTSANKLRYLRSSAFYRTPGLPGWPFWGQISEIWSQITLVGPKFNLPFGSFLALCQVRFRPLQKLDLATWVLCEKPLFQLFD